MAGSHDAAFFTASFKSQPWCRGAVHLQPISGDAGYGVPHRWVGPGRIHYAEGQCLPVSMPPRGHQMARMRVTSGADASCHVEALGAPLARRA